MINECLFIGLYLICFRNVAWLYLLSNRYSEFPPHFQLDFGFCLLDRAETSETGIGNFSLLYHQCLNSLLPAGDSCVKETDNKLRETVED